MPQPLSENELARRAAQPYCGLNRKSRAVPKPEFQGGRPPMPASIKQDPDAAAEWRRMCRLLAARGTLSKADGPFLELYCATYSEWLAARRELKEKGLFIDVPVTDNSGNVHFVRKENPARKVIAQCVTTMRQFLQQLGATPASRDKARPAKPDPQKEAFAPGTVGWILEHAQEEENGRRDETVATEDSVGPENS
jgi:P27 family predicted phage terminase small subunit